MRWSDVAAVAAAALLAAACTPRESMNEVPPEGRADAPAADALVASVQATPSAGRVHFVLQVTNPGARERPLEFSSGQSFDFVVRRGDAVVWRWSDDQMFTQALRSETMQPSETRRFEAEWTPPAGASSEYAVTGVLVATNARVEQTARFRLP